MDLSRITAILRRWGWLLLLAVILTGASGYISSKRTVPVYRASTRLLVNQVQSPGLPSYNDLLASERLAKTYSELLRSYPLLEETVRQLQLPLSAATLEGRIAVRPVRDTQLVELTVEDTNPQRAATIADGLAKVFIEYSQTVQSGSTQSGQSQLTEALAAVRQSIDDTSVRLSQVRGDATETARLQAEMSGYQDRYLRLIDTQQRIALAQAQAGATVSLAVPARLPSVPVRPRPVQTTILAALFGLLAASGIVLAIEYFDDRIRDIEEVRRRFNIAPLAALGFVKHGQTQTMSVHTTREGRQFVEGIRLLRTNLGFLTGNKPQVICITSAVAGEGKSTVAAHLAVMEARANKRVVLIDADLRSPGTHTFFGMSNARGLSLYLANAESDESPTFHQGPLGIRVLTAGPIPPNPTELLGSPRMADLLASLRADADVVIVDTAPVLPVADTLAFQPSVDGTLLVINQRRTGMKTLARLIDTLKPGQGRILGIAFNYDRRQGGGYGYGYGYGYGTAPDDADLGRKAGPQWPWRGRAARQR